MIVLRLVAMLGITALMAGCTAEKFETAKARFNSLNAYLSGQTTQNPCILGIPQIAVCYYVVTITDATYTDNRIKGKTALKVCEQNRDSANSDENCSGWLGRRQEISFPVKGSPVLQRNSDYEFLSQVNNAHPTAELECVVSDDATGTIDRTRCQPRTRALVLDN